MAKILVIDDEKIIRDRMTKLLELDDYETFSAESGKKGLEIHDREQPEIALVDVKMPGMDGIETLKAIKRTYPLVEVIMLTGHGTIDSAVEGLKSGATDYLTKPTDVQDLIEKAKEAFGKRQVLEDKIRVAHSRTIGKSAREILRETGA